MANLTTAEIQALLANSTFMDGVLNLMKNNSQSPTELPKITNLSGTSLPIVKDGVLSQADYDSTFQKTLDALNGTSADIVSTGMNNMAANTSASQVYVKGNNGNGPMTFANFASAVAGKNQRRSRKQFTDLSVLKSAVAAQNLEAYDLRVGDYYTANGHTYVIAGLNVMKGSSTPYRVSANHVGLICIPHTTQKWNESGNTYTGADGRGEGYLNSDLHYYLENTLLPLVQTDLGSSNLIAHSKLLSNAVNKTGFNRFGTSTGCASSWTWESNCYISALSEVQVYGSTVWSSSGYDTGEACRQLDVFRLFNMNEIFGGEYPWLRDVVSASRAAIVRDYGVADILTASSAYYVAALILFH